MPTTPSGYPLDLQGNNPANFIIDELHTFNTASERLFVPMGGPFYRIDFEIRNSVTNQLLLPNTDYKVVHLQKDATILSGKNVNAGVYVHNTNIPSVRINYRIIGGRYADTVDTIRQLFLDNPPTNADTIPWDHVFGAPAQMPPVEHLHDMLETYGYGNLITVLEQLRVALISGDGPAIDAIYRYVEITLTNSGFLTEQDVLNLVNQGTASQVRVYATYDELRAETEFINDANLLYVALGKNTRYDGRGRQFSWSVASDAVDDNDKIIKPTIILNNGNGPGRLLTTSNVEIDLKNSLNTLGRKITNEGVVVTDLSTTFPLTVDLDTVVAAGLYWIAPTATNKPEGCTKAHMSVEVSETFVTQTLISIVQDDRNMVGVNDVSAAVTTARVFTRNGQLLGGNYLWEDWRGLIDRDTLNIALKTLGRKIDADFKVRSDLVDGANNTFNGDLNSLILPGPWYVAPTSTNMPIGAERGTVDVLQSGIYVTQTFSSILHEVDISDVNQTVVNGPDVTLPTLFKRILTLNVNKDTVVTVGDWISFSDLPTLNRALKSVGRRINPDYSLDTRIATIKPTNGADLNTVVEAGTHWVDNTCAHRPPNVDNGMLYVENSNGNYIFQRLEGGQNTPSIVDNTATRTDYTEHVRVGTRTVATDPFTWSAWESMLTKTRGLVNGIDAILAETNLAGTNLNTHVKTGKHWVGNSSLNSAFNNGILEVTTLNASDVIQVMYNRTMRAVRYGSNGVAYAGHTWTAWDYGTTPTVEPLQCNLGITIHHLLNESRIIPTYIGEDAAQAEIRVLISGRVATININAIANIAPVSALTQGYVYLFESSPNVFTLEFSVDPPALLHEGNYTTRRGHLPPSSTGQTYLNSSRVFLGYVASLFINGVWRWAYARSWFQDPGAVDWFEAGSASINDIVTANTVQGPVVKARFNQDLTIHTTGELKSVTSNQVISLLTFLAWGGEEIDLNFVASYTLDHPTSGFKKLDTQLSIAGTSINGDFVVGNTANIVAYTPGGRANAYTNGDFATIAYSRTFKAPITGLYKVLLKGTAESPSVAYYKKTGAVGVESDAEGTSLSVSLRQVHAFRNLVITNIPLPAETLTVIVDLPLTSGNQVDVGWLFEQQHGGFQYHPLLTLLYVDVVRACSSIDPTVAGLSIFSDVPQGLRIVLRIHQPIFGAGGRGGRAYSVYETSPNLNGQAGGHAIFSVRAIEVINYSELVAGGGGGGAGSLQNLPPPVDIYTRTGYGGGGGGGAGRFAGYGGLAGGSGSSNGGGNSGTNGADYIGGSGGTTEPTAITSDGWVQGGVGGRGGDAGQPGEDGAVGRSSGGTSNAGTGGAAGLAIKCTESVTMITTGIVYGSIVPYAV